MGDRLCRHARCSRLPRRAADLGRHFDHRLERRAALHRTDRVRDPLHRGHNRGVAGMSNLISAAVQRRVVGSATRKAVLLYMADKAADDGSGIWSSKANIARDLELGIRAVQYAIRDLVTAGLLIEIGQ